ncbi:hypothetical protein ACP6PL_19275 [Dapis sp. BLCC M126]|uniref:hypothetical protein n=1 Tax=Dapis sp. BLCC M126 TaxID=3400189 RepID=UPI003CE93743
MVNATQKRPVNYADSNIALLLTPSLQKLAKLLYRTYLETHPDQVRCPLGVAISPVTYRAGLIFSQQPILLPGEFFVPVDLIESKIY